jgi:hypothetical protein
MGAALREVGLAVHLETEAGVVTNQLRSARIEERCAPRLACESQTVLNQRRNIASSMNARAVIETTCGSRSLVTRTIGTAITADDLTPAATSLPHGSTTSSRGRRQSPA